MSDLPNSPYLDLPLRTLREVADLRYTTVMRVGQMVDQLRAGFGDRAEQTKAACRAYCKAVDAWQDAEREAERADAAAAQRAA